VKMFYSSSGGHDAATSPAADVLMYERRQTDESRREHSVLKRMYFLLHK
jgi:hypothetical protein